MNNPQPATPANSGDLNPPAIPRRSEVLFLCFVYLLTIVLGSTTISACGPGCCFVLYSIFAGVSGLLMLRPPVGSRILLSLFGMWHQKEARDTWGQIVLRQQIQSLQQQLDAVQSK